MKSLYTVGILAAAITFGSVAMAYPTFNGETGIVALPNALTTMSGSYVGAADLLFANDNTVKVRAIYGLNEQSEVGASVSLGEANGFSLGGKYRLTDPQSAFNMAVGGSFTLTNNDSSQTNNDTSLLDMYLVGTQAFAFGPDMNRALLGTLGVHFIKTSDDNTIRPFIGAQLPLGNHTQLAAEYQVSDGNLFVKPLTSVVVRHRLNPQWTGQVGWTNATGFGATRDYRLFIGTQYNFGRDSI